MTAHRIAALHLELAQLEHEAAQTAWQSALDRYMTEARKGLSVAEVTAHKTLVETRAVLQSASTRLDSATEQARSLGISTATQPAPGPTPTTSRSKVQAGKGKP